MNDKLKPIKPCSYCGGELYLDVDSEFGGVGLYHVKDTHCVIPDIDTIDDMPIGSTLDDLVDRINTRPIEDALRAELAALREQTRWRKWPDEWSGINGDYQVVKQSRTLGSYYEDTVYLYPPLARDQNLFHGDPVVFYRENQPLPEPPEVE